MGFVDEILGLFKGFAVGFLGKSRVSVRNIEYFSGT